jgi:hypothetical protein
MFDMTAFQDRGVDETVSDAELIALFFGFWMR